MEQDQEFREGAYSAIDEMEYINKQLNKENAELKNRVAQLEEDKATLDWIKEQVTVRGYAIAFRPCRKQVEISVFHGLDHIYNGADDTFNDAVKGARA